MALSKEFERELNDMFLHRTDGLRNLFRKESSKKTKKITRDYINDKISILKEIATDKFGIWQYRIEFVYDTIKEKSWRVKGRGYDNKKLFLSEWLNENFENNRNLIYIFWGANYSCIYIGRTGNGGSRPTSHLIKYWFNKVKRIQVIAVKSSTQLHKLECLAIHRFQPLHNRKKSAKVFRTQSCPLCTIHKKIEKEVRHIFSIRR